MVVDIITDGSQIKSGKAGIACIVRIAPDYLPIKILGFLGQAESSQAELWAAIIAFGICKFLSLENANLRWLSDSKTTLDCLSRELSYWSKNSWLNKAGNPPRHLEDWKTLDHLSSDLIACCLHKQRSTKHRDLSSCDKASRWAARLGEGINSYDSLQGKNSAQDPRYAWQVIPLIEVLKLEPEGRAKKLNELFAAIKVYKK